MYQALQEQLTSSVQEVGHLIEPISTAANGEAAQLGHKVNKMMKPFQSKISFHIVFNSNACHEYELKPFSVPQVSQLVSYFTPLVSASMGMASKIFDHQQQMNLLDQTKTLTESALQMLYAAKEGGGNPKVHVIHSNM